MIKKKALTVLEIEKKIAKDISEGPKTDNLLRLCFEKFLSGCNLNQSNLEWENVNLQPKRKTEKIPACPHYRIIELCANIIGIKNLNSFEYFCGLAQRNVQVNNRPGEKYPFSCCLAIKYLLLKSLELAQSEKLFPPDRTAEKVKQGKKIIKLWEKTIPRNMKIDKKARSDQRLISVVENLLKQLEQQATGGVGAIMIFISSVSHFRIPCATAPQYHPPVCHAPFCRIGH